MTKSWQQQNLTIKYDQNWNKQTLILRPGSSWCFFLVEEQSYQASEAGKVSKASASLPAWAGGPVQAYRTSIFFGVKLMFVSVMNFGHV